MKIKNILLSAVAASTLFAFRSQANDASAKSYSWHKGVPGKIVGYWSTKKGDVVSIHKNGIASVPYMSAPYSNFSNPIYKTVGKNKFVIRPSKNSENNNGKVKFGNFKYTVKYSNNHVSIKIYPYNWNNMHRTSKP